VTAASIAPRRAALREFGSAVVTIMVKELRSRMRGRRAFVVLTVYLAVLALIAYGVYTVSAPNAQNQFGAFPMGPGVPNASAQIGQSIFAWLSVFQLLLVAFIAPAFTAGQISLEREKQTLDLLISTPLRPGAIVVGKLLAALAFVVLLILASIPISAIVLMYGGAAVEDLVRQQIVLLASALGLGSIGLFFSAWLKRTQAATVLTYCTMLGLTIGTVMLFIFWTVLVQRDAEGFVDRRAPEQLLYANPGIAIADVVGQTESGFGFFSSALAGIRGEDPFSAGVGGEMVCRGDVCFPADEPRFGPAGPMPAAVPVAFEPSVLSGYWWPRFVATFAVMSLVLTLLSMRLVVPAGMRFSLRRRPPPAPAPTAPIPVGAGPTEGVAPIQEIPEERA
jgi:ABC-type transport system involved in multi-copper enzyme maturation permease subunit